MTNTTTYHIVKLREEFIVEVRYNDLYTPSFQLGGYYKTFAGAENKLSKFKEICEKEKENPITL